MLIINHTSLLVIFSIVLLFLPQQTESCLPKWFRQERSAEPLEGGDVPSFEATNEVNEDEKIETTTLKIVGKEEEDSKLINQLTGSDIDDEYELVEDVFEGEDDEEESEEVKYNLKASTIAPSSISPDMKKKMEQWMVEKCTNRCENNATCSLEMYYQKGHGPVVIPVCHCPHGWEGERCERRYVQEFYAAVSGSNQNVKPHIKLVKIQNIKNNGENATTTLFGDFSLWQSPSSAIPAVTFLVLMLIMFISIVLYAYKRMSRRIDETTYTMSHMCPPEAFTVLKTPCGRKISVHESLFSSSTSTSASSSLSTSAPPSAHHHHHHHHRRLAGPMTSTPAVALSNAAATSLPHRTPAIRGQNPSLFQILRNQGSIPSRSINESDTPKQYKSVPRVEVSAINYSGHIDFSNIEYPEEDSRPNRTSPPPYIAINIEDESGRSTQDPTSSPIVRL